MTKQEKAIIDKACKWFEEHVTAVEYTNGAIWHDNDAVKIFAHDFRKAMEAKK